MTTPVKVRSATLLLDQEAARANTACTAMYLFSTIEKVSKHISLMKWNAEEGAIKNQTERYSQTLDVEALEHDLGCVLTVLGSVERRLGLADENGMPRFSLCC
jgi:hypothetical protein